MAFRLRPPVLKEWSTRLLPICGSGEEAAAGAEHAWGGAGRRRLVDGGHQAWRAGTVRGLINLDRAHRSDRPPAGPSLTGRAPMPWCGREGWRSGPPACLATAIGMMRAPIYEGGGAGIGAGSIAKAWIGAGQSGGQWRREIDLWWWRPTSV